MIKKGMYKPKKYVWLAQIYKSVLAAISNTRSCPIMIHDAGNDLKLDNFIVYRDMNLFMLRSEIRQVSSNKITTFMMKI